MARAAEGDGVPALVIGTRAGAKAACPYQSLHLHPYGKEISMDVYAIITARILEKLAAGTVPWRKPWNANVGVPRNLVSKHPYRGVNVFMLHAGGYSSPWWLTYRQAQHLGGSVRKGERGTTVVYWQPIVRDHDDDAHVPARRRGVMLRTYTVFNVEQCERIEAPGTATTTCSPIEEAERILAAMPNPPQIRHGGAAAYYRPRADIVQLPAREAFASPEVYYSVAFHEFTHATGHASRLDRPTVSSEVLPAFGSPDYSKEELIAEMGAAFLCAVAGIETHTLDNAAAYIAGWLRALRDDTRLVVGAAAHAQRAADYILARALPVSAERAA